jgi:hypothetical protein
MSLIDLLALLQAKRTEIGTAKLAESLGVSDVTIRSICTGNYRGKPDAVLHTFADKYVDVVHCPHIDALLNRSDCKLRHNAPKPFGGASKLLWWEACQQCEHNKNR